MPKPHAMLRGALMARDIDEAYLARKLCRGVCYVSQRMMGRKSWPLDEAYAILDMIHEPHKRLPDFFPPMGMAAQKNRRTRGSVNRQPDGGFEDTSIIAQKRR